MSSTVRDETEDLTSALYLRAIDEDSPMSNVMEHLPSYIARGQLYLSLLFVALSLTYCAVSRVDITRTARATTIPEGKTKPIQPSVDGVVTEVLVGEGDAVVEGQALVIVESREVGSYLSNLRAAEMELSDTKRELQEVIPLKERQTEAQVKILEAKVENLQRTDTLLGERIEKEIHATQLTEETYQLELAKQDELTERLHLEQKNASSTYDLWTKEFEAMQKLLERRAANQLQFLSVQRSKEAAAGEVKKLESMLREATQERQILGKQFESSRNQHQQQLATLREQLAQNRAAVESTRLEILQLENQIQVMKLEVERKHQMAQFRHRQAKEDAALNLRGVSPATLESVASGQGATSNRSVMLAPVNGRIGSVLVRSAGETVTRGTTLMTLIPGDVALVAELQISNQDVGLMKEGLPVRLKFDAFPFAEYGVITGKLSRIVPGAEEAAPLQPSFYRAYASLDQDYFRVKGKRTTLLAGMTATAEITTEKKSLLALLLQPFQELGKIKQAEP